MRLTQKRQQKAEEKGIIANIGRKVKAQAHYAFRCGDIAEIVGWELRGDCFFYIIKFQNGECDEIPIDIKLSGHVFVD